jgi:CRP/FNR family transcriptional regulator, cyclic AMP receptor protein
LIGSAFAKGRDLLSGTLLFSGLSDEDADAILASAHRTRYPARATIFTKGEPGQSMMAILQGRVRISVPSSEGREAVFKIMGEGEIFGEIALLDGKERTADAVAITACELLVVERRAFLPVLRRRPELCIRLLELLCERLRRTDQQVEDLLIRHFENRLARDTAAPWTGAWPSGAWGRADRPLPFTNRTCQPSRRDTGERQSTPA